MADYRRFISYMYLYENGRKTVNSGFARVERRNGQCRLHVHMTGMYGPENSSYKVYMLIRENDSYIGIPVGLLRMRQQTGELDMTTDSERLMATDYSLNQVSGMVILSDDDRIYGTRWDDEPLETDFFAGGEKTAGGLVVFSPEEQREEEQSEMVVPGNYAEAVLGELVAAEEVEEVLPEVLSETMEEAVTDQTEEVVVEENTLASEEQAPEIDAEDMEQHLQHDHQQDVPNAYEVMLHQYPQMYPFDDNSVEVCIRLDLQDIGKLPMQCWLYGSNSFLLHGYYCYRHLILARMRLQTVEGEDGGAVYIFGVPGIRQHREQYMASMFGFRDFKPVSRENTGGGAFGYWYVRLDAV